MARNVNITTDTDVIIKKFISWEKKYRLLSRDTIDEQSLAELQDEINFFLFRISRTNLERQFLLHNELPHLFDIDKNVVDVLNVGGFYYNIGAIHIDLESAGYELCQTGGGCSAYIKTAYEMQTPDGDDTMISFMVTEWKETADGTFETDARHPIAFPAFLSMSDSYSELEWNRVVHSSDELAAAESEALRAFVASEIARF